MSTRTLYRGFLLCLELWGGGLGILAEEQPGNPSILLVVLDDLGFSDYGFLGGDIRTPNIDALVREGS